MVLVGEHGKLNARGIFIEDLNIIDWDFSAEYIAAVEAKQVAEQNLIKTKTEQEEQIVIAEAEAKKKRIAAEADSDTAIIAAKAEAERIRIEAEATAEAIYDEIYDFANYGIVKRCHTAQQNNRKVGRSASPRYRGRRLHAHDIRSHGVSI